jgi:hypothetical protein
LWLTISTAAQALDRKAGRQSAWMMKTDDRLLRTLIAFQVRLQLSEIGTALYRTRARTRDLLLLLEPGSASYAAFRLLLFLHF